MACVVPCILCDFFRGCGVVGLGFDELSRIIIFWVREYTFGGLIDRCTGWSIRLAVGDNVMGVQPR